jgi:hypothetical protein
MYLALSARLYKSQSGVHFSKPTPRVGDLQGKGKLSGFPKACKYLSVVKIHRYSFF